MSSQESFSPRLCVVSHGPPTYSETFIRQHWERLPLVHFVAGLKSLSPPDEHGFESFLIQHRIQVVLAEYGPVAVSVMKACRRQAVPLVVHFHGYDCSRSDVITKNQFSYLDLFARAAAVIAVSRTMVDQLIALGAPRAKIHYLPYGVDMGPLRRSEAPTPVFLAVGRFVSKKSPQSTLGAFAKVAQKLPTAKLVMIGDGPLWNECQELTTQLGIAERVAFLGAQSHDAVKAHMAGAFAFVQHSTEAGDGDSEGTPVAILEAQACGLPVVSTRHAGIRDVVVEGQTGLLVEPGDVDGMAEAMLFLGENPDIAGKLGARGRERVLQHFSSEKNISQLAAILSHSILPNRVYSRDSVHQ